MSLKLHLGVIDVPYVHAPDSKSTSAQTTGDVAEILEAKYGIMEFFWQEHSDAIAPLIADFVAGQLENIAMGAPPPEADSRIVGRVADEFRLFIDNMEMNGQPGVPTKASLEGKSKRFKRNKGPPRASFVDTGLYEDSFAAWLEAD